MDCMFCSRDQRWKLMDWLARFTGDVEELLGKLLCVILQRGRGCVIFCDVRFRVFLACMTGSMTNAILVVFFVAQQITCP